MHDESFGPMTAENVEEFHVRISDSPDLVVVVATRHAASDVTTERYSFGPPME